MMYDEIIKVANEVIDVLVKNQITIEFIDNVFDEAKCIARETPIKKMDS